MPISEEDTRPGISVAIGKHPDDGRDVLMLTLLDFEVDTELRLVLHPEAAYELADILKTVRREARRANGGRQDTAVVGVFQMPTGTMLEFVMIPDPGPLDVALTFEVEPQVPIKVVQSDREETPKRFVGWLDTSAETSLFIGELSRLARVLGRR